MTPALFLAYVHLVASILVVGYFLFWLIMMVGLPRLEPPSQVAPLTAAMLAGARWPPAVVPWKLRLTLPGLGWAFIAVVALSGTGVAAIAHATMSAALGAKLALLLLLVGGHARLARRPTRGLARLTLALALGVVLVSVLLPR